MTQTQKRFFNTPRTMEEIMNNLFKGDAFAANNFQNENINNGSLKMILINNYLHIVKSDFKPL
jgi:hypothetical protein